MAKKWSLYKHISPSGKVYVGISSNVKQRWAAKGYYYCLSETIFSKAIRKYGWDNIQHIVIERDLTHEEACIKEKEQIAYYKSLNLSYNITDGGEGFAGKHSEQHIKNIINSRISNSKTDYIVIDKDYNYIICDTEKEVAIYLDTNQSSIAHILQQPIGYTCKKHYLWKHKKGEPVDINNIKLQIQNALTLRKDKARENIKKILPSMIQANKEERAHLSKSQRKERYAPIRTQCRKMTAETRQKISVKSKGRDMSELVKKSAEKRKKPVLQMLDNLVINTFGSISEAAGALNIPISNIARCAKGKRKSAGGFNWKFKKDYCYVE